MLNRIFGILSQKQYDWMFQHEKLLATIWIILIIAVWVWNFLSKKGYKRWYEFQIRQEGIIIGFSLVVFFIILAYFLSINV